MSLAYLEKADVTGLRVRKLNVLWMGPVEAVWESLLGRLKQMPEVMVHLYPGKLQKLEKLPAVCAPPDSCILVVNVRDILAMDNLTWGSTFEAAGVKLLARAETEEPDVCLRLVEFGWKGVLLPDITPQMLFRALTTVSSGELWLSRATLSALVREYSVAGLHQKLTPRENEILRLLGQGCNNQQIANALFISRDTVRWHFRSLYAKMGTHNRKLVAAYAAGLSWPQETGAPRMPEK
jgi:NarL family two-component system response regulator LiaR